MPSVLGVVPVLGREALALQGFGEEPLFLSAVRALADVVDGPLVVVASDHTEALFGASRFASAPGFRVLTLPGEPHALGEAVEAAEVVVVHDPLCPLVPSVFLRRVLAVARSGQVAAAVRPVVDTVKQADGGVVGGTIDRDTLRIVSSPVALPSAAFAALADPGQGLRSLVALVAELRRTGDVQLVPAPASARRIEDEEAVELMVSVDVVGHRLRER